MDHLLVHPLTVQTVYADLQQVCMDAEASGEDPSGYDAVGEIRPVSKLVNGKVYWYAQYIDLTGKRQQSYLGPDSREATQVAMRRLQAQDAQEDRMHRRDMVRMLQSAGYPKLDSIMSGAFLALSRTGLFRSGVTLVGTPAYHAILHQLGFSETRPLQTNDVDISIDRLHLAIPEPINVERILQSWNEKIVPVPALNRKHGEASLKIRGRDFHVDFLAPGRFAESGKPIHIGDIEFHAQSLPFLDYLIKDAQMALLMTNYGMVVPVPQPARFMWHKCVTAACRPHSFEAKRKKDLVQAGRLFEILKRHDPLSINEAYQAIYESTDALIFLEKVDRSLALREMSDLRLWRDRYEQSTRFVLPDHTPA